MLAFQLPMLPEWVLLRSGEEILAKTGQSPSRARRDADTMVSPGRIRGGLNWYRALVLKSPKTGSGRVSVPTLHIWSDGDIVLGRKGAELTTRYVDGPYRFEVLRGVSHWIPDEVPRQLDRLLAEHLQK